MWDESADAVGTLAVKPQSSRENTNRSQDEAEQIMSLIGGNRRMVDLGAGGTRGSGATLIASDQEILNLTEEDIVAALNREKARIR